LFGSAIASASRAHSFRYRGHAPRIGYCAVLALDLQDDIAVADDNGGEIAIV